MKCRIISETNLPGGLLIESENPEEALLLRIFYDEKRRIKFSGCTWLDKQISLDITFEEEKDEVM